MTKTVSNVYTELAFELISLWTKWPPLSQTTFSNAFSRMEILQFQFNFHWSLFIRFNWQYPSTGLDKGLASIRWQAIIWTNANPIDWHIYAALRRGELKFKIKTFNTLRPRQNGRYFPCNIFKCIFLNENVWILSKISLKFVPKGPINDIPALVKIMAWCRSGDKSLSETLMVRLSMHRVSLGLNELNILLPVKQYTIISNINLHSHRARCSSKPWLWQYVTIVTSWMSCATYDSLAPGGIQWDFISRWCSS